MIGSWTSLVSVAWAALGSGGVVVGRSRVETRRCITGVFGWVVADSGGIKTFPPSVEMMLGEWGWMLRGFGSLGEGGLVTVTLIRLAMTISTAMLRSGVGRGDGWSSSIIPEDTEPSGDFVVVLE